MKIQILFVLLLALAGTVQWDDPVWADKREKKRAPETLKELQIGQPAPKADVKMTDISGKNMSLRGAAGAKGLLVIFSCNTCPFVIAWEDRYLKLAEKCRESGVGLILVNSNEGKRNDDDSLEAMKAHAEEKGYSFPYVADARSDLADAFGAARTPHVFLLDSKLKLAYRGAIDDNSRSAAGVTENYLMDAIAAMSSGKPIAVQSTKSIGCSIKRKG